MARRRRVVRCPCGEPARRVQHAKWCSKCYRRKGSPKRECSVCGTELATDVMVGRRCRPCISKAAHAKRIVETYGLSAEDYDELLRFQDGRCYICHRRPGTKRLAVDHDHQSGAVRGLLDRGCNRDVLGHLREDLDAVRRIEDYLTNPPAKRLWPGRDVTPQQGEG